MRILTACCATAFVLAFTTGGAEARTKSYEINGRKYTYDTSDPKAVAAARKLIETANAADFAKAKAEAALTANPLAKVFGSQAQNDAKAADERLAKAIAEHEKTLRARQAQQASAKPSEMATRETSVMRQETNVSEPPSVLSSAAGKNVFVDAASGIRTTFMSDGTVHEEPVDPSASTGSIERIR